MNRYFPESQPISPEQRLDRPKWAKGAQLTQEALDTLPQKPAPYDRRTSNMRRDLKWVKALAAEHTGDAIETLAEIMKAPAEDGRVRVAAAVALLDRAWGRPGSAAPQGPANTRAPLTDPEQLHARIVAVVAEVGAAPKPRQLREVIDAEPAGEPE